MGDLGNSSDTLTQVSDLDFGFRRTIIVCVSSLLVLQTSSQRTLVIVGCARCPLVNELVKYRLIFWVSLDTAD